MQADRLGPLKSQFPTFASCGNEYTTSNINVHRKLLLNVLISTATDRDGPLHGYGVHCDTAHDIVYIAPVTSVLCRSD